jgi:hypothetical protein
MVAPSGTKAAADKLEPLGKTWFEGNYTKHEYRLPMRDGIKLFALVYTPKDTTTYYPILLQRTPYSLKPYTVDVIQKPLELTKAYVREKFIFALQDVRGPIRTKQHGIQVLLQIRRGDPSGLSPSTFLFFPCVLLRSFCTPQTVG